MPTALPHLLSNPPDPSLLSPTHPTQVVDDVAKAAAQRHFLDRNQYQSASELLGGRGLAVPELLANSLFVQ